MESAQGERTLAQPHSKDASNRAAEKVKKRKSKPIQKTNAQKNGALRRRFRATQING